MMARLAALRPSTIFVVSALFSFVLVLTILVKTDIRIRRIPPSASTQWEDVDSPAVHDMANLTPGDGEQLHSARVLKYTHAALATTFGAWHHDVLVPVGASIEQVTRNNNSVRLYVPGPYHLGDFGFDDVLARTDVFHGTHHIYHELYDDMYKSDLFPDAPGAMIDLVVLGTCEYDMDHWSRQLLDAWDRRPEDRKFTVVCIIHEVADHRSFKHMQEWTLRGAMRWLTISEHVSHELHKYLLSLASGRSHESYYTMTEYMRVDTHVPVLPLPDPKRTLGPERKLQHVAIQGIMDSTRRDYKGVFEDLIASLQEDPELWGYAYPQPGSGTRAFVPIPSASPLQLHIIGTGWINEIPEEIKQVIKFHRDLQYWEFYELMQGMDVVLPAFAHDEYYVEKASSTVVMSIQCNVPLLVSRRFHDSYAYAADERVTIVRPTALREVHAIAALRSGAYPPPKPSKEGLGGGGPGESYAGVHHRYAERLTGAAKVAYERDVKSMLDRGWQRSNDEFASYKRDLWRRNRGVVRKILNDE